MSPRKIQAYGLPTSRTPSPPDSLDSTSSSPTCFSARSGSSSSSSSSSTSTWSPPPSPPFSKADPAPPPVYSTSAPRSRRVSPPQTLLGAIDENSGIVEPDVPLSADKENNPVAKLHVYSSAAVSKKKATLASASSPPANEFDSLVGPNGEKFTDLRMNRKTRDARGRGWMKLMCFA
ncbi:hypothetical protein A1O3_03149 [Capronia epimyces CBS 606.96]|uniref:Uncharacterized protein n=1 Tax=Capronia epimyces CBS 606.96 TaxID=1182542 RepID=W9YK69_9EURO|nr:uncharacterized protein A1O3_03149 [Capronia epimyces CBS 606.96]EXJ90080.1 hypothetical protein A1O3_03149 [Capronia epimyces CBS 606.96]